MPVAQTAPDIEAVVCTWLRADMGLAHLVDTRVGTRLPPTPAWPFVRLSMVGGPVLHPGWLYEALLDFHCYGATQPSANRVGAECQRALAVLSYAGIVLDATITRSRPITNLRWLPDPSWEPPQPRYVFTAAVTYHPLPQP